MLKNIGLGLCLLSLYQCAADSYEGGEQDSAYLEDESNLEWKESERVIEEATYCARYHADESAPKAREACFDDSRCEVLSFPVREDPQEFNLCIPFGAALTHPGAVEYFYGSETFKERRFRLLGISASRTVAEVNRKLAARALLDAKDTGWKPGEYKDMRSACGKSGGNWLWDSLCLPLGDSDFERLAKQIAAAVITPPLPEQVGSPISTHKERITFDGKCLGNGVARYVNVAAGFLRGDGVRDAALTSFPVCVDGPVDGAELGSKLANRCGDRTREGCGALETALRGPFGSDAKMINSRVGLCRWNEQVDGCLPSGAYLVNP